MSQTWRIQKEVERLGRLAAEREKGRREKEAALKQEEAEKPIREAIAREIETKKAAYQKQKEEKEKAERLKGEEAEEKARLKAAEKAAKLQDMKEKEDVRRKKAEGWTVDEMNLLQQLKELERPLKSEDTTIPSIIALERTARLLYQNNISLENMKGRIKAFDWAVESKDLFLVQLLAKNHEFQLNFPQAKDNLLSTKETTLQIAARAGDLEIIDLILSYLPQAVDSVTNDIAVLLAILHGHKEVAWKLLKRHSMPLSIRFCAVGGTVVEAAFKKGWSSVARYIITTYSIKPDRVVGAGGKTVLHFAAEGGYPEIIELFLSPFLGIDPNVTDSAGSTPLLKAVEHGHVAVVKLLLADNGIDINHQDIAGNSPLLIALGRGHLSLAQLFLTRLDLKANNVNGDGVSALMMAASLGCSHSVWKLLHNYDIDIHHRALTTELLWGCLPVKQQWSALEIASARGFHFIVHMLSTFIPGSSSNALSESTLLPIPPFPVAPTHSFVRERPDIEESQTHQESPNHLERYDRYKSKNSSSYESHVEFPSSSYERDEDLETNYHSPAAKKKMDEETSKPRRNRRRCRENSSYSSITKTVQSTASLSVKLSDSLLRDQSPTGNLLPSPAPNTPTNFQPPPPPPETKAHRSIYSRNAETISTKSTTVNQNIIQASEPPTTSDGVNWGLAAPATVVGVIAAIFAGYAFKLQRNGAQTQLEQLGISRSMNQTLQKMETSLVGILTVIQAARSLPRDGPSAPPPDLPILSQGDLQLVDHLERMIRSEDAESREYTPSLIADGRSGYTSDDHSPDRNEPTDSVKLTVLDRNDGNIDEGSHGKSEGACENADIVENSLSKKDYLVARFKAMSGRLPKEGQGVGIDVGAEERVNDQSQFNETTTWDSTGDQIAPQSQLETLLEHEETAMPNSSTALKDCLEVRFETIGSGSLKEPRIPKLQLGDDGEGASAVQSQVDISTSSLRNEDWVGSKSTLNSKLEQEAIGSEAPKEQRKAEFDLKANGQVAVQSQTDGESQSRLNNLESDEQEDDVQCHEFLVTKTKAKMINMKSNMEANVELNYGAFQLSEEEMYLFDNLHEEFLHDDLTIFDFGAS